MASKLMRLPYHRALFYFGPQFLATSDQWQASFQKLAGDILRRQQIDASLDKDGPYGLVVRFGRAEFHINALSGMFWIRDIEGQFDGPLLGSAPEEFLRRALNAPAEFEPIVGGVIIDFADNLILEMEVNFDEALRTGAARIEARVNSRYAEFSVVEPRYRDQVRVFMGMDDLLDDVDSERIDLYDAQFLDSGERLYSYGVAISARDARQPKKPERPTNSAKKDRRKLYDWERKYYPIMRELRKANPTLNDYQFRLALQDHLETRGHDVPGHERLDHHIKKIFSDRS